MIGNNKTSTRGLVSEGLRQMDRCHKLKDHEKNFYSLNVVIWIHFDAGSHWLRRIVDLIMGNRTVNVNHMPFLEIRPLAGQDDPGYKIIQEQSRDLPRVISTHLPFQLIPKSFLETDGVKVPVLILDHKRAL